MAHHDVDMAQWLQRLAQVSGWLRGEVARAIARKRTPELAFQIVAPTGEQVQP
jgi:ribosome-binding factor A